MYRFLAAFSPCPSQLSALLFEILHTSFLVFSYHFVLGTYQIIKCNDSANFDLFVYVVLPPQCTSTSPSHCPAPLNFHDLFSCWLVFSQCATSKTRKTSKYWISNLGCRIIPEGLLPHAIPPLTTFLFHEELCPPQFRHILQLNTAEQPFSLKENYLNLYSTIFSVEEH